MVINIQGEIQRLRTMGLLEPLLADRTTGKNILWATNAYAELGQMFACEEEIREEFITGDYFDVIQPRSLKAAAEQSERTRKRGEVSTPEFIIKSMCDHLDSEWFRRKSGFWKTDSEGHISFPNNRTWKQYADNRRMEITCGEGPFLTLRHSPKSGELISLPGRIGLIDRKLRAVSENASCEEEWLHWAYRSLRASYGYEFQGDSLLLARINVLMTFAENLEAALHRSASISELAQAIDIITWNLWQMDGLTGRVPYRNAVGEQLSLFQEKQSQTDCRIYNWRRKRSIRYLSLKGENANMKFDCVIGNPPYQEMDNGAGASATPIYDKFIEEVKRIDPKVISFIIPAKWYSGGKGLNSFRATMLQDKKICRLVDYTNSLDCFPNVDIAGGVCYFVRNRDYNGDCLYTSNYNGKETTIMRDLAEFDTFVRYPIAVQIIHKVRAKSENYLSSVVSSRKPFGLATNVRPTESGDIKLRYNGGIGFFHSSAITVGNDLINKYKVMISYLSAEHAGQPDKSGRFRVLSTTELLPPKSVCTETYLIAGSFDTEAEAVNMMSYLKTKFVRFLIAQMALSQHITKNSFCFVPLQDFKHSFTDQVLYTKYDLTDEEINFIENMIKEMV
jgi:hypothetical protein